MGLKSAPTRARPYVIINMVSSADGRVSVEGKASGIGSRVDRSCMRALRAHVDAVMVGAGSLRAEKMSLGLDIGPDNRSVPQPLAVVVGGAGDVPLDDNLIIAEQELVLALPEGVRIPAGVGRARASVLRTPKAGGRVDLELLLRALRTEHEVRRLLVEGGPVLNRALVEADLVDEIFLTLAPKLLLGREHAILSGAPGCSPRDLKLVSAYSVGDELFLRYRLQRPD